MEHGFATLDVKAVSEGEIEGYGAVFGNRDNGGDVIAAGAFSESLAALPRPKMLFQHDPDRPIGVWTEVAEDERGLRVKGRFLKNVAAAREVWEMVKEGAIDGLSIGYRTLMSDRGADGRIIRKAEVWEVSLVTFPMNPMARIDAAKAAAMTERDMERLLVRDAGLSRSVALSLMGGGFKAVNSRRDAGGLADLAAHMRGILKTRN